MTQSTEPRGTEASTASARGRLIEAAVESFAAKGFHGTSTRDIAAAAGMSPAALYVHHKSKEDLLYLISRDGHNATLRLVRRAAARSSDPVEQFKHIVTDFTAHHARNHTRARIVSYELHALSAEHQGEITAIRRAIDPSGGGWPTLFE
jgi:AcrR family transcriptional regulator